MKLKSDPRVQGVFDAYPSEVNQQMRALRTLVLETASEIPELVSLEETLKWGEPSYLTKHGSTLRMNWKKKNPNQFAMYFKCTSKLVSTFKEVFDDSLKYETTRAVVFQLDDEIPEAKIKECIKATLRYHKVKHLPRLGINGKV